MIEHHSTNSAGSYISLISIPFMDGIFHTSIICWNGNESVNKIFSLYVTVYLKQMLSMMHAIEVGSIFFSVQSGRFKKTTTKLCNYINDANLCWQ